MEKRVLVADDDVSVCRVVSLTLENEGYRTECAYDGLETLDKVQRWNPDLLILDVMMPKLDGWNVVYDLRSRPETAELPIVMLTGLGNTGAVINSLTSGADIHLRKPFDPEELLAVVHRLCPLTEQANAEDRSAAGLHPSLTTGQVIP